MRPAVDPDSPVPLYHQIAEAIRAQMERGELAAGDALEPMRQAATQWGVNLHTVRHAYAALAREGLLEMRSARGTRVTAEVERLRRKTRPASEPAEDVDAFVERFLREASDHHGLTARELAERLAAARDQETLVSVVECSAWQCESHARELSSRWRVDARPWPLTNETAPDGEVVATYFHYNDIRRRWPELLERVRFLTIRVDLALEAWLEGEEAAVVVERDEPTAIAIAADLRTALRRDLDLRLVVTGDPAEVIRTSDVPVLVSPREWSDLSEEARADERCAVVRYEFDRSELMALAAERHWGRR